MSITELVFVMGIIQMGVVSSVPVFMPQLMVFVFPVRQDRSVMNAVETTSPVAPIALMDFIYKMETV